LPIGGVREKALAARRAGTRTFILPRKNERDLLDIPKHLRQDVDFVLVDRIEEVLEAALLPPAVKEL
jgi:ATP-dependent Lon protease